MTPSCSSYADDLAAAVHLHHAGLHQPIHARVEAAEARGQRGREHVHRPLGKVDRRGALVRLGVERRALGHVVRDVGDVDAQPEVAVPETLDRHRVVEVARVLAVDRHGRPRPEVRAPGEVALPDLAAEPPRLGQRRIAVLVDDAVLAQDDLGVHAGRVDRPEHLDHAAERAARGRGPARDLHDDHLARRRAAAVGRRDLDVHDEAPVECHHEAQTRRVHVVAADDPRRAALEDPDDPALGPVAVLHALDARHDAVAVHGLVEVGPRDVDVAAHALERLVRHHEAEAPRVRDDAPDDQVHVVGRTVAVPADLDEVARGDQGLEPAPQGGALVLRHAQHLLQLLDGCGMIDRVANRAKQVFCGNHACSGRAVARR